jgi:hypothetical protein
MDVGRKAFQSILSVRYKLDGDMNENFLETQGEKPEVQEYEMRMWAGVIPIYACLTCGRQEDVEADMIAHVLEHKTIVKENEDE